MPQLRENTDHGARFFMKIGKKIYRENGQALVEYIFCLL